MSGLGDIFMVQMPGYLSWKGENPNFRKGGERPMSLEVLRWPLEPCSMHHEDSQVLPALDSPHTSEAPQQAPGPMRKEEERGQVHPAVGLVGGQAESDLEVMAKELGPSVLPWRRGLQAEASLRLE